MIDCQDERSDCSCEYEIPHAVIEGCSCANCDPDGKILDSGILVWSAIWAFGIQRFGPSFSFEDADNLEHEIRVALLLEKGGEQCESSAGSLVADTGGLVEKLSAAIVEKLATTTSSCVNTQKEQSKSDSNGKWQVVRYTPGTDIDDDEVVLTLSDGTEARDVSVALTRLSAYYYYIRQVDSSHQDEIDF